MTEDEGKEPTEEIEVPAENFEKCEDCGAIAVIEVVMDMNECADCHTNYPAEDEGEVCANCGCKEFSLIEKHMFRECQKCGECRPTNVEGGCQCGCQEKDPETEEVKEDVVEAALANCIVHSRLVVAVLDVDTPEERRFCVDCITELVSREEPEYSLDLRIYVREFLKRTGATDILGGTNCSLGVQFFREKHDILLVPHNVMRPLKALMDEGLEPGEKMLAFTKVDVAKTIDYKLE